MILIAHEDIRKGDIVSIVPEVIPLFEGEYSWVKDSIKLEGDGAIVASVHRLRSGDNSPIGISSGNYKKAERVFVITNTDRVFWVPGPPLGVESPHPDERGQNVPPEARNPPHRSRH
jgi:hypothetical protein